METPKCVFVNRPGLGPQPCHLIEGDFRRGISISRPAFLQISKDSSNA